MNTIKIVIGGRNYEISCGSGEEKHIADLAHAVSIRFDNTKRNLGAAATESLALVVTALMMEEEIRDLHANKRTANTEAQDEDNIKDKINNCIAEALAPFTAKLEALAISLEVG